MDEDFEALLTQIGCIQYRLAVDDITSKELDACIRMIKDIREKVIQKTFDEDRMTDCLSDLAECLGHRITHFKKRNLS